MADTLKVGVAGLGTVGAATVQLLQHNASAIAARCGRPVQVVAVSARDASKDRGFVKEGLRWEKDPLALAQAGDIDVVVETIGGSEGVAKILVETALKNGKHVVTANKALLATHGASLAALAEKSNVVLAFEAAVAGGIPIVKTLREGLAANQIHKIVGILNGTSNFILTMMQNHNVDFAEALAEAQRLGYAEADPSFDIDGIDTAQKLSVIAALAFACIPNPQAIHVEGIRHINKTDMQFAAELGYNIKLLGIASITADGAVEQRVHPCMLPANSPIGVDDVYNAIVVEGSAVGRVTLEGRGAGGGPTASSVVMDITDIARGYRYAPFNVPASQLTERKFVSTETLHSAYYLRLSVEDKPGVLSDITGIFGKEGISMRSVLQHLPKPDKSVEVVLTTHDTAESAMSRALKAIAALPTMTDKPHMIRIEDLGD
jgi:homoserine dehydrogenase